MTAEESVAGFLLMFSASQYESPKEAAAGLISRLAFDGYCIVPKDDEVLAAIRRSPPKM